MHVSQLGESGAPHILELSRIDSRSEETKNWQSEGSQDPHRLEMRKLKAGRCGWLSNGTYTSKSGFYTKYFPNSSTFFYLISWHSSLSWTASCKELLTSPSLPTCPSTGHSWSSCLCELITTQPRWCPPCLKSSVTCLRTGNTSLNSFHRPVQPGPVLTPAPLINFILSTLPPLSKH